MKLKILDKNAHWWAREKNIKWATQDKDGDWWLINGSEFPEVNLSKQNMKIKSKRKGQFSMRPKTHFYLLIVLATLLGISLALNVVYYLM